MISAVNNLQAINTGTGLYTTTLTAQLGAATKPGQPISVLAFGYGNVDLAALKAITDVTGAGSIRSPTRTRSAGPCSRPSRRR